MTDLLPCPFCGKPPILDEHPPTPGEDDSFAVIRCASCGISKERNFTDDAVRWWNTRTTLSPQDGGADQLCIVEADLAQLQSAVREACDLLAERTQGSPARSAGHNARLRLERALSTMPARLFVPAAPPAPVADRAAVIEALEKLEAACDAVAAGQSQKIYVAMLDAGMNTDLLSNLDCARRAARAALALPRAERGTGS
jgi:Restriction alleviation protein Lar